MKERTCPRAYKHEKKKLKGSVLKNFMPMYFVILMKWTMELVVLTQVIIFSNY